ncbi:MAG: EamA family transporter [Deinococcota bacterium]
MRNISARGILALIIAALLSGASFAVTKDALSTLPVPLLVALRVSLAALASVMVIPRSRTIGPGLILGLLGFAGLALQTLGLSQTDASKAGFIAGLAVVLTPLMLAALTRKRPPVRVLFALYAAVSGLALLTSNPLAATLGDVWVIASALFYALYLAYLSRVARRHSALVLSAVQLWPMVVLAWLWTLPSLPYLEPIPTGVLWQLLFLGLMVTALASFLRVLGERNVAPFLPPLLLIIEPITATVTSTWLIAERLPFVGYLGGLLIIIGMLIGDFRWQRRSPVVEGRYTALFIDVGKFQVGSGSLELADLHYLLTQRLHKGIRHGDQIEEIASRRYALLLESTGSRDNAKQAAGRVLAMLRAPFDDQRSEVALPPEGAVILGSSGYGRIYRALRDVPKDNGHPIVGSPEYRPYVRALAFLARDAEMRWGLQQDAFSASYQPLCLVSQVLPNPPAAVVAQAAILRWHYSDPKDTSGAVTDLDAGQFLPMARTTGFASRLELHLLSRVLTALASSPDAPRDFVLLPISADLLSPEGAERIRVQVAASGVNPARLKLELDEDNIATNLERMQDALIDLGRAGLSLIIRVSLEGDDPAVQRARQYLPLLPIDYLSVPARILLAKEPAGRLPPSADEASKQADFEQRRAFNLRQGVETLAGTLEVNIIATGATHEQLEPLQQSAASLVQGDKILPVQNTLS